MTIAGYLENYLTGTGYSVTPVVGFVRTGFRLQPDQVEVVEAFEVPLAHVLDPRNHQVGRQTFNGIEISYYEILFQNRRIWGVTAGMIVELHQMLR